MKKNEKKIFEKLILKKNLEKKKEKKKLNIFFEVESTGEDKWLCDTWWQMAWNGIS